jgi:hypothetical protein
MKRILLISFLFFLNISFAQPYLPVLEENNEWSVDIYYEPFKPPNPPYFWTITEQISVGGIVVIDGREYTQILRDEIPSCFLREENGVVYKYDENASIDRVLFDFNLNVGETFNLIGSAYDSYPYCSEIYSSLYEFELTVETVETIELAGEMRKVISFEYAGGNSGEFRWVEGIGNITGFDLLWEAVDVTEGSALVCFTKNGTTYFFNNATACDNTTLYTPDNLKSEIVLAPNPVQDISILQLPSELNIDTVRIYDITGKVISEESITKNYITINAMDYASGLYFYQATSENEMIKTERFVVN